MFRQQKDGLGSYLQRFDLLKGFSKKLIGISRGEKRIIRYFRFAKVIAKLKIKIVAEGTLFR